MFGQVGRLWLIVMQGHWPQTSRSTPLVNKRARGDLAEDGPEITNWPSIVVCGKGDSMRMEPRYARCLLNVRSLPSKPKFLASRREKTLEHWSIPITVDLTLLRSGTVLIVMM